MYIFYRIQTETVFQWGGSTFLCPWHCLCQRFMPCPRLDCRFMDMSCIFKLFIVSLSIDENWNPSLELSNLVIHETHLINCIWFISRADPHSKWRDLFTFDITNI